METFEHPPFVYGPQPFTQPFPSSLDPSASYPLPKTRHGFTRRSCPTIFDDFSDIRGSETLPPHFITPCRSLGSFHHSQSFSIIPHCPSSSPIVLRRPTLSFVVPHCPSSSPIVLHHPSLSLIVPHHPSLSPIVPRCPPSFPVRLLVLYLILKINPTTPMTTTVRSPTRLMMRPTPNKYRLPHTSPFLVAVPSIFFVSYYSVLLLGRYILRPLFFVAEFCLIGTTGK